MTEHYQVSFMPWTGLRKAFTVGPIAFWSYPEDATVRISDQEMRSYLDRYFKSYVDNTGQPVQSIVVCSYGDSYFRTLNAVEYEDLRNCCDILVFVTIAPQVRSAISGMKKTLGPPSSDAFELVTQNFELNSDDIHVRAGTRTSAGWRIGEITFSKPWSVGGSFGTPNEALITAFHKSFDPGFPKDLRDRLFRALEWFRLAHTENEQISEPSKIVMMATAFEILLQFPRNGKRKHFVKYMETNIASPEFNKGARVHEGKTIEFSLAGCWAWDFYELRSKIVHGDPILGSDLVFRDWITHSIVADLVLLECMERDFLANRCIGDNVYSCLEKVASTAPEDEKREIFQSLTRWFLGFSQVHRVLGWLPEKDSEQC